MSEKVGETPEYRDMEPHIYYAEVLTETLADVDSARDRGNWTAVAALRRRAQDAREKMDEALEALASRVQHDADPYADAADSDLTDLLIGAVSELPVAVVTRLQAAIDDRLDGPTQAEAA